MTQRTAVLLTTFLTAFVIVVTLGVASATSLRSQEATSAQPATDSASSEISAVPEIPATATPVAATATTAATTSTPQTSEVAAQPAGAQQSTVRPELVDYEGTPAYEIKYDGGVMYVDAGTGAILFDTQLAAMVAQLTLQARAGQSRGDTTSRLFFESAEDHDRD